MHCRLARCSCRGVFAVRRFPYLIVVFVLSIVLLAGGAFVYFRPGDSDAVSTPSTDVQAAAVGADAPPPQAPTLAEAVPISTETPRIVSTVPPADTGGAPAAEPVVTPTQDALVSTAGESPPTALPALVEAVPILTETPRVLSTFTPADMGADSLPAPLPTVAQVVPMYSTGVPADTGAASQADTSLIDLPGEPTELPIVMVAAVVQEDLGLFPNVQMPGGPVGPNELYVAHGDIYGTGRCYVHVFRTGEAVTGLSAAAWRLVRISAGVPDQREELVQRIQNEAASDPSAGGSCPFG